MQENFPVLICDKPLKPAFQGFQQICITSNDFTIGRGLNNSVVIPYISISRNHCIFKKTEDNSWYIEDNSTFGIAINGNKMGKGKSKNISHEDIITLEPTEEFIYRFKYDNENFESPKKRFKRDESVNIDIINDVKMKFEESQNCKIKHIEDKINNAKQMQTTSKILKQHLEFDMERKIHQLENDYASQIENLDGEENDVEKQKALLIQERNEQLAAVKQEMEGKIADLMKQIKEHNETEEELLKENSLLKEKLLKEREEFLTELSRESSSKQDMLEELESKMKEQEEVRLKEKNELEDMLKKATEHLRLAKEKELELQEQNKQKELKMMQELENMKKSLQEQVEQTEQQRLKTEQSLNEKMELMKKVNEEDKMKMEILVQEREEIQKKLNEAQVSAEKSLEELRSRVQSRETELASLAADRIQKQAEQSTEVINTLQEQLENVRSQLKSVESEKDTLLENLCLTGSVGEGCSKQMALAEVGELMESELQCSICAELFVTPITLNCCHTFCKYCITMWKKKKKDCPNCRASITSECKSLVLESFIEKMVQSLTDEVKKKRRELLVSREELETELTLQLSADTTRRSSSYDDSDYYNSDSDIYLEEIDEEYQEYETFEEYYSRYSHRRYYSSDSDSGSDDDTDDAADGADAVARAAAGASVAGDPGASTSAGTEPPSDLSNNTGSRSTAEGGRRRRRDCVPGLPGAYYGGYGRCYRCAARGHWAPGCPLR